MTDPLEPELVFDSRNLNAGNVETNENAVAVRNRDRRRPARLVAPRTAVAGVRAQLASVPLFHSKEVL